MPIARSFGAPAFLVPDFRCVGGLTLNVEQLLRMLDRLLG